MIRDLRQHDAEQPLEADVCIVGAGPAGLALAAELAAGTKRRVLLLEGGGREPGEVAPHGSYQWTGLPYSIEGTRRRAIGGTSHAWKATALMRPFEAIDFAERDWVEESGWPFSLDELRPHYERAAESARLPPKVQEASGRHGAPYLGLPFRPERVRNVPIYRVSSDQFRASQLEALPDSLQLFHHAHVLELRTDRLSRRVVEALVRNPAGGAAIAVRAEIFVIAGGAVENVRLLLASNSGEGIGNDYGLVGRYFMEHPRGECGLLVPSPDVSRQLDAYAVQRREGANVRSHLYLSEEAIRGDRILGMFAAFWRTEPDWLSDELRDLAHRVLAAFGSGTPLYAIGFQSEQAPRAENRVTLKQGASGEQTVWLTWRLSPLEYRTIVRGTQIIQEEVHLLKAGVVFANPHLDDTGGYEWNLWRGHPYSIKTPHHAMGTTRMHNSPEKGVVDAECRVHGMANLYVAGGSVFPTGSHMNPTYTILAMAVRLARHLAVALKSESSPCQAFRADRAAARASVGGKPTGAA